MPSVRTLAPALVALALAVGVVAACDDDGDTPPSTTEGTVPVESSIPGTDVTVPETTTDSSVVDTAPATTDEPTTTDEPATTDVSTTSPDTAPATTEAPSATTAPAETTTTIAATTTTRADYPPPTGPAGGQVPKTIVVTLPPTTAPNGDELADTGSDSRQVIWVGAAVLLAGLALAGVAYRRRRPST